MPLPKLILPESAKPRYRCEVCGKPFTYREEQEWMRHVASCAGNNHDEIIAANRHDIPVADPELYDYQRRTGKLGWGRTPNRDIRNGR
jgi:hypothetical protein